MVRAADINAAFFAVAAAAAAESASASAERATSGPCPELSSDTESEGVATTTSAAATSPRDSESGEEGSSCTSPSSWPATPESAELMLGAAAQRRLRVLAQARRLKEYRCLLPVHRYVDVPAWQRVAHRTRPGAASLRRASDAGTSSQCSTPHARRVRFCGVVSEMLYCVEAGC